MSEELNEDSDTEDLLDGVESDWIATELRGRFALLGASIEKLSGELADRERELTEAREKLITESGFTDRYIKRLHAAEAKLRAVREIAKRTMSYGEVVPYDDGHFAKGYAAGVDAVKGRLDAILTTPSPSDA